MDGTTATGVADTGDDVEMAVHGDGHVWSLDPALLAQRVAFERLVVPLADGGSWDRGLSFAAQLAEQWDVPLQLMTVDEHSPTGSVGTAAGDRLETARRELVAAHPSLRVDDELLANAADPAAAVAAALHSGSPDAGGDLVVFATEAAGAGGGPSFAERLAHDWGGPMLLLGPKADPAIPVLSGSRLVVGLDGSAMAERVLPYAKAFADRLGLPLQLVFVVSSELGIHIEKLRARGEHVSESAYLREVAERLGVEWEILHGDDPASMLASHARDRRAALIALSTHGGTGLARTVFGSVAMAAVHAAEDPVLVLRSTRSTEPSLGR